jgi:acyl-CoA reductase-like NAD-dependent aldehyde dehydrogenase
VPTTTLIEPATGQPLTTVPRLTVDDLDHAVRNADRAFHGEWRKINTRDRGPLLNRFAALIRENKDALAKMEARNVGKPIRDARDEVGLAANVFEYYAGATNKVGGQTIPGAAPGVLLSFRDPVGVCGIIVPWNFPISITSWESPPARALGNTKAVCRKCYVHPAVLESYLAGSLAQFMRAGAEEKAIVALLKARLRRQAADDRRSGAGDRSLAPVLARSLVAARRLRHGVQSASRGAAS